MFDHGPVQEPQQTIGIRVALDVSVFRERQARHRLRCREGIVSQPNDPEILAIGQIEAMSQIDDRTHDEGLCLR
jgi:hypothetical protein